MYLKLLHEINDFLTELENTAHGLEAQKISQLRKKLNLLINDIHWNIRDFIQYE
jgi:hypothetical protein